MELLERRPSDLLHGTGFLSCMRIPTPPFVPRFAAVSKITLAACWAALGMWFPPASTAAPPVPGAVVFEDSFDADPRPEWSRRETGVVGSEKLRCLGEFGFEHVRLNLKNLPPHAWLELRFEAVALRTWEGNSRSRGPDVFTVSTGDGRILARTNFAQIEAKPNTQAFPGFYGIHREVAGKGALQKLPANGPGQAKDRAAIYPIAIRFPHSETALELLFDAVLDFNRPDEAWGLRNVRVYASDQAPPPAGTALAELWERLASDDGAASAAVVQELVDRAEESRPFLASKLTGTARPEPAELLLNPDLCHVLFPKSEERDEPALLKDDERRRALAAFALQVIGTEEARVAVAQWQPAERARPICLVTIRGEDGAPQPLFPLALQSSCGEFWSGRTGPDGIWRMVLPADSLRFLSCFTMSPATVRKQFNWNARGPSDELPKAVTLTLEKPVSIGGRVTNDAGEPVANATVVVSATRKATDGASESVRISYQQANTDKNGRWTYSGMVKNADSIELGVHHPLYPTESGEAFYNIEPYQPLSDLYEKKAVLKMARGIEITGIVRGPDGNPSSNAYVEIGRDLIASNTRPAYLTDKEGRFRLAVKADKDTVITVKGRQCAPELRRVSVRTSPVELEFDLKPARVLKGRVVDGEGRGIPGATVFMDTWREARTLNARVNTDRNGAFEWTSAPEDEVKADVYKQGYADNRDVIIKAGEKNEIVLKAPTVVRGKVFDAETGAPIPSFAVIQGSRHEGDNRTNWMRRRDTETFRDGKFDLELTYPYSAYVLRIEAPGYLPADSEPVKLNGRAVDLEFKLTKAVTVPCRLVSADGKPLAKTKVWKVAGGEYFAIRNGKADSRASGDSIALTTDEAGVVALRDEREPVILVALHDEGFVQVRVQGVPPTELKLTPWGRVQGRALYGTSPAAGVKIGHFLMETETSPRSENEPRVSWGCEADTAQDGSFAMDRVPPGRAGLGIWNNSNGSSSMTWTKRAQVRAGESTTVDFGGSGRPVVGQLVIPKEIDALGWNASVNAVERDNDSTVPTGADFMERWMSLKRFAVAVNSDGSFRAENAEPGKYQLSVSLRRRDQCGGDELAQGSLELTIPEIPGGVSDEPLDAGKFPVKALRFLEVGNAAPELVCAGVEGGEVSLAALQGKFVLVDFWATWCGPCVQEMPVLKKLWEEFKDHPDFAMISVSLDQEASAPRDFATRNGLGWKHGHLGAKQEQIMQSFGVRGIPSVWLIGPDGKVIAKNLRGEGTREAVARAFEQPKATK